MKNLPIFLFLCVIIGITSFRCRKESTEKTIDLVIESENSKKEIYYITNDIEFTYCLLNKDSLPTTSFKEGENILFHFSIKNNRNENLSLVNNFITNNDFCKVYSFDGSIIGSPFKFLAMDMIGSGANPFPLNAEYQINIPWIDTRENWSSLHSYFQSTHQNSLPKGKYYTLFSQRFRFDRTIDQPSLYTDSISFKINFIIN